VTLASPSVGPLVIYHGNCPDGFAAALAAWLRFEGRGEYRGMSHDQEPPEVHGRDVYLLDIAFDLPIMQRLDAQARRLVVLDHHKSAADKLHGFKCRCGSILFDLSKSAARLAWEHFHPGAEVPALVQHVEDRDLLRWLMEDSSSYLLALDAGPYNFHRWAGVMRMPEQKFKEFLVRGSAMQLQFDKLAQQMADQAVAVRIQGHEGLQANAPFVFHTAVGALLAKRCGTYGAVWCLEPHEQGQRVRVGLRSEGFDVIPLAQAFGGGGHPNASAFRLPLEKLQELVSGALRSNL
jgi:uncharacterized protein